MSSVHSEVKHGFQARGPAKHLDRLNRAHESNSIGNYVEIAQMYLGIAARKRGQASVDVGFSAHDGTYSTDFAVHTITETDDLATSISDYIVPRIREYQKEHNYKFLGAGLSRETLDLSLGLSSRLWREIDVVPIVTNRDIDAPEGVNVGDVEVDEMADSMARKCVMFFGPSSIPRVQVGFRNAVEVDAGGRALMTTLDQYKDTVGERTWKATMTYAERLKKDNIKIAFFNSTPQGGGVALMRHALVRFLRLLGINIRWYVPMPRPEVFRITKTNHNILQGVAAPDERLQEDQIKVLEDWVKVNVDRYWTSSGGPLSPRKDGGADFIVVDDPQLPGLVNVAKNAEPERPVVFRSHIQIRSDLVDNDKSSPTAGVFKWLYDHVKEADMFISHPVSAFVPAAVQPEKVAYMPATTDWLDGLNKELPPFDSKYYHHEYNLECHKKNQPPLDFPTRDYIVQIARFDPSKGIPDVIASYAKLRRTHMKDVPREKTPQLCIAGHGAIDDPDFTRIMDETSSLLADKYADIVSDVSVMRLSAMDQTLNMLMSNAKIALQLSTREGFEVKVSEALHKGVPTIATKAGGIPLQVEHEKSGFLVETGDSDAVAQYMYRLLSDEKLYEEMSRYAAAHVSDEVSTVGNALSWLYLAESMTKGEHEMPNGRWVNDMARERAGMPYVEGETRLPRDMKT